MGGLLQQFGLGLRGVNRVANPVDLKDGELRLAQNAALSTKHGRAALLKRKGMSVVHDATDEGATGKALAVFPMPFTDIDP
jgi:hypothetical protein